MKPGPDGILPYKGVIDVLTKVNQSLINVRPLQEKESLAYGSVSQYTIAELLLTQ
jgi:hypothetical protein